MVDAQALTDLRFAAFGPVAVPPRQFALHGDPAPDRPQRRVRLGGGNAEAGLDGIAGHLVDRAAESKDQIDHPLPILRQPGHRRRRRLGFGQPAEILRTTVQDGRLLEPGPGGGGSAAGHELADDVGRKETAQPSGRHFHIGGIPNGIAGRRRQPGQQEPGRHHLRQPQGRRAKIHRTFQKRDGRIVGERRARVGHDNGVVRQADQKGDGGSDQGIGGPQRQRIDDQDQNRQLAERNAGKIRGRQVVSTRRPVPDRREHQQDQAVEPQAGIADHPQITVPVDPGQGEQRQARPQEGNHPRQHQRRRIRTDDQAGSDQNGIDDQPGQQRQPQSADFAPTEHAPRIHGLRRQVRIGKIVNQVHRGVVGRTWIRRRQSVGVRIAGRFHLRRVLSRGDDVWTIPAAMPIVPPTGPAGPGATIRAGRCHRSSRGEAQTWTA